LARLDQAKTLGGIGSILELIPGIAIVGYILTLIAVKNISDELQDKAIFDNMLYAVITGIIGVIVGFFLLFSGIAVSAITAGISAFAGAVAFFAIIWIVLIISAIFVRRSFEEIASRLSVNTFRTAGTLYLIGAVTTIIIVGFVILLVAYIFQIVAFFSIKDTVPTGQPAQMQVPPPPALSVRFCPKCGAQVATDSKFCPSCGSPV
jgi:uncharacterized membrane protein